MVRGSVTSTVLATVELGEGADTDVLSEVDVSGDGGWGGRARLGLGGEGEERGAGLPARM